jgi:hypothetical protein
VRAIPCLPVFRLSNQLATVVRTTKTVIVVTIAVLTQTHEDKPC